MVVRLSDGLRRPVLVDVADLELLEVAAVRVGARRLAGGLVGLDGGSSVVIRSVLTWRRPAVPILAQAAGAISADP